MAKIIYMDNGQLELCPRFVKIWGLSCQRPNNKNLLPIHAILYRMLIIDRYSYLYSYSSTSTRTRTCTHVIIKYSDSDSDSHILQVLILVLVLVNLVLAPALVARSSAGIIYSGVHSPIWHDLVHITTVTGAEYECKFEPTKDTPYLALTGELWGVFCDNFGENRPCHTSTALYGSFKFNDDKSHL